MKSALQVFTMPDNDKYFGGVATVIKNYLENNLLFNCNGYNNSLYNFIDSRSSKIKNGAIKKIAYGIHQAKDLVNKVNSEKVDIVHIHTSRNSLFVKDVLLGAHVSKKCNSRIILTVHVGDISTVFEKVPSFLKKKMIRLLNKYFDKVIFLTSEIKNQFLSSGLDSNKSFVLYNTCQISCVNEGIESNTGIINILFVGMINRDKGILELLDAMANPEIYQHAVCHICGEITDNSIRELFEEKTQRVKERIHLHGYVTGIEKERLFSSCDVLALPSYHEGFPIVILEGITCGCAIIATRVGAIPEVLGENNCIFVEIGDSKSIERALITLINDRSLLAELKNNNRELSNTFSTERHIIQLCELYGECRL